MDFQCRPPDVHIDLNKSIATPTKISTVDMFVIVGHVKLTCNTSSSVILSWESNEVDHSKNGAFSMWHVLEVGKENVTILPKDFSPGLYYLRLVAEMNKEEGAISYDYGFLEVSLPKLIAKISGVNRALKGTGSLVLDGSDSYDPHEPSSRDRGLEFTWLCQRQDDDFPTLESLPIDAPLNREKFTGSCYGYGVGKLNSSERMIRVDIKRMTSKKSYVFQLIVKKDDRIASAYHLLRVDSSIKFSIR